MKILLAKRRALGDTVFLSSSVEVLCRAFPQAEISVMAPAAFLPVLEGNPRIRRLWAFEEGWLSLLPQVRREGFDHLFQLHASSADRWRPLAWLAGAKAVHLHRQNNETEKAYGRHPNALEWDAFCFRSVFGESIGFPASPRIHLSEREKEEGRDFWRQRGADPAKVVFLGLGASRPTKRWLPRHFARLAELLRDRKELVPALVVGPGEQEELFSGQVLNELRAKGMRPLQGGKGDFVHGAGVPLRDLAKALSAAKAYVGNDSGPKHVAAAVGIPTFTLFGPEDPQEWHPYDRKAHPLFFLEKLSCRREDNGRWCGIPLCQEDSPEKHRCMRDLDPYDVYQCMERFL